MPSQKASRPTLTEREPREIDQLGGKVNSEFSPSSDSNQEPVTVVVEGVAVAKGRPRMGRGRVYTPRETHGYETQIQWVARLAMRSRPPIAVPVSLVAVFDLPIPPSWSAHKRQAAITGTILPASRPDLDNYLKAALDGINGLVIDDDALVVDVRAQKRYSVNPKLVLTVTPLSGGAQ